MIRDKLFIGYEVEGNEKKELTLFIPKGSTKSCDFQQILKKVRQKHIKRFYFGAGDRTGVSEKEVLFIDFLLFEFPTAKILIECTIEDLQCKLIKKVQSKVELILVIHNDKLNYFVDHLKFVNDKDLYWHVITSFFTNKLNDKLYKGDFEL